MPKDTKVSACNAIHLRATYAPKLSREFVRDWNWSWNLCGHEL